MSSHEKRGKMFPCYIFFGIFFTTLFLAAAAAAKQLEEMMNWICEQSAVKKMVPGLFSRKRLKRKVLPFFKWLRDRDSVLEVMRSNVGWGLSVRVVSCLISYSILVGNSFDIKRSKLIF